MDTFCEIMRVVVYVVLCGVFLKTITGFHFPWEICECCDRKWRDIQKEKRERS